MKLRLSTPSSEHLSGKRGELRVARDQPVEVGSIIAPALAGSSVVLVQRDGVADDMELHTDLVQAVAKLDIFGTRAPERLVEAADSFERVTRNREVVCVQTSPVGSV